MHAVRNTGIEGVVQYHMVDCACTACTTHEGECEQKDFADDWITVNLLKCSKDVDKVKISKWFKPIHGSGAGAASGDLMESGDEDNCEINCDEIESDVDPDESDDSDETSSDKEQEEPVRNEDSDKRGSDGVQEVYGVDDEHDVTESDIQQQVISAIDEHYETDEESLIELFSEEYISSDEEMCDNSSQNQLYADEIPTQIDEEDPNINFNWMKLGDERKAYNNNYTSLRNFIERRICQMPNW